MDEITGGGVGTVTVMDPPWEQVTPEPETVRDQAKDPPEA
jgi:hypothetical protein